MLKRIILFCLIVLFSCSSLATATTLRVGLVTGQETIALQAQHPFLVTNLVDGSSKELPQGKYFVQIDKGELFLDEQNSFKGAIRIDGIKGKALPLVNGREYPGSYQLLMEQNTLTLVNQVELENYLSQILPGKTMVVWPDEVIKAQAVAARSYALYFKAKSNGSYDLSANDEELPYIGVTKYTEKKAVTKLIMETAGQYVADNSNQPIYAVTTSCTGGKTDSAQQVLGRDISYLVSVEDFDSDSPEYHWDLKLAPILIQNMLEQRGNNIGKLNCVRLSMLDDPGIDRTSSGRVRYVIFAGDKGSVRIDGDELVKVLKLNSKLFDIVTGTPPPESLKVPVVNGIGWEIGAKEIPIKVNEGDMHVWKDLGRSIHMLNGGKDEKIIFKGRGKGAGLGLSAWGARGMVLAKETTTYEEILKHYYPGTHLVK